MTEVESKVDHKQLAKELERRRFRRRILMIVALGGAIALAVIYGTCGRGWGLGAGKGKGEGEGAGSTVPAPVAAKRCVVRVDKTGVTIDGAPAKDPVAQCAKGADVTVTGDAAEGTWTQLHDALTAAHVDIALHDANK